MKIPLQLAIEVTMMRGSGYPWELRGGKFRPVRPKRDEVDLGWATFDSNVNPSEVLTQFLAVPWGDNEAMLKFLQQTGTWEEWDEQINPSYLWSKQDNVRQIVAGKRSAKQLLDDELSDLKVPAQFEAAGQASIAVELSNTWSTILFACWSERARDIKRRHCARNDCAQFGPGRSMFEVTRPDRRYCTTYCAHLENLREIRAAKRREE